MVITAASQVTETDLPNARLGSRFGRLDLMSQMALLAVEKLGLNFDSLPRERIAICLVAKAGSLATDVEFWKGRDALGGPSPTLFAYTLPSAAIGEIAIRHRLTGPNLCFVGDSGDVLPEAVDLLRRGEADACVCLYCQVVSAEAGQLIQSTSVSSVCALFLQRAGIGQIVADEFDRDMESACAKFRA